MKTEHLMSALILGLSLQFATAAYGAETASEKAPPGSAAPAAVPEAKATASAANERSTSLLMPVYQPPKRGAPKARVGGGTRGSGGESAFVTVITPPDLARTARAQPTLYWYLSGQVNDPIELTLIDDKEIKPLLEIKLDRASPGINAVDLSAHGVRLEAGRTYQWSVAIVRDARHRSGDVLSSAWMEFNTEPADLNSQLAKAGADQTVYLFAEAGYWYEALDTLSRLIAKYPGETRYAEQRLALLEQADLPDVLAYARHLVVGTAGGQ